MYAAPQTQNLEQICFMNIQQGRLALLFYHARFIDCFPATKVSLIETIQVFLGEVSQMWLLHTIYLPYKCTKKEFGQQHAKIPLFLNLDAKLTTKLLSLIDAKMFLEMNNHLQRKSDNAQCSSITTFTFKRITLSKLLPSLKEIFSIWSSQAS